MKANTISKLLSISSALFVLTLPASASTWNNSGSNTDWNTSTNWTPGGIPGTADTATFTGAAVAQPNISSSDTITAIDFTNTAKGYILSASSDQTLTLTSTGTTTSSAIFAGITNGSDTISAPIILASTSGTQTFAASNSGTLVVSGDISGNGVTLSTASGPINLSGNISGSMAIAVTGGVTNLSGNNTYSGGTTLGVVSGTTLGLGSSTALGTGTLTILGAFLNANANLTGTSAIANAVNMQNNYTIAGSGALTFSGVYTNFGNDRVTANVPVTFAGGQLYLNDINTGSTVVTLSINGSGPVSISDVIANNAFGNTLAAAFVYSGTGTAVLSGPNTYTGATKVTSGMLSVASINSANTNATLGTVHSSSSNLGAPVGTSAPIGLGTLTTTGTLQYTGTGETTDRAIGLGGTTGGGAIDQEGSGLLKFVASSTTNPALVTANGTTGGSKTFTIGGSSSGGGELDGTILDPTAGGATSLVKVGTDTWTLAAASLASGASTYSGGTSVTGGTLIITNNTISATSSSTGTGSVTVSGGATLGGTGRSSGTGFSISGGGTTPSTRANLLVGMTSTTDINTTGVLTLLGSGTSTLTNANLTFNLNARTAGALGSNPTGSGTELGVGSSAIGFDTAAGSVQLTLNLQNESGIIAENTAYVLIAGTVASGGGGSNDSQYTGLTLGRTIINSGGITETVIGGTNFQLAFGTTLDQQYYGSASYLVLYQDTTNHIDDIDVVVVPEPGAWALMLGGLGVLLVWQRRRGRF